MTISIILLLYLLTSTRCPLLKRLPERPTRILIIGCGQGTTTSALAGLIPVDGGRVDALDPTPHSHVCALEQYVHRSSNGSPYTLGEAQTYLTWYHPITFHQTDAIQFLADDTNKDKEWEVVVLVHSVWYFDFVTTLRKTLEKLKGRMKRVFIAEHALRATSREAQPHVLAPISRATLEVLRLGRTVEEAEWI
ncbi:hypothetical protein QBC36DRAFT_376953 [Triangularia setosa]|uniref:Uncharacterized protein n=1 Tax=Triangularia setosa TaxID=2587417 RepID=A0AAN6WAH2_9PEZI|nr:hypothetical protein QBC36DRAFT_376953 [Podospora setosa]